MKPNFCKGFFLFSVLIIFLVLSGDLAYTETFCVNTAAGQDHIGRVK
jgi:hypothetical protein